jgi:alpha-amylase/alpha-mannosidase (GH57 family)
MSAEPLYLAFLWHMHQPLYKDLRTGVYTLPWVRLHGTKDYFDMAAVLEGFPAVRQTFNLVPSLLDQIEDYAAGAIDPFLEQTLRPAADLSAEEKQFLLEHFFMAHPETMILVHPRYRELLHKRGGLSGPEEVRQAVRYFSTADYRDLQLWFNLAWFDPLFQERDPLIRELIGKGRGFTEEEKTLLAEKQREVLAGIVPLYRRLQEQGQIELTTSPYYHPILPLLCDTEVARESLPNAPLPGRFRRPEDAEAQIRRAVESHTRRFGRPPKGLWPSEGSVSEALLPLVSAAGFEWLATDEEILARSLGIALERDGSGLLLHPEPLCRPYRIRAGAGEIQIVFRDQSLSNLLSFSYAKLPPREAAEDLIGRLHAIRARTAGRTPAPLVTIILDGENAWEYYPRDGTDFLGHLYARLSADPSIRTVSLSAYLAEHPAEERLTHLFPGSWINHNFRIWIGHEEDNLAWEHLRAARDMLSEHESGPHDPDVLSSAREACYAAEGSDWCWWYGDDHYSPQEREFDRLFRDHLANIYRLLGQEPPTALSVPILREDRRCLPVRTPTERLHPVLDGRVTNYFEWLAAGEFALEAHGSALHQVERYLDKLLYGFDDGNLYIRVDFADPLHRQPGTTLSIHFLPPISVKYRVTFLPMEGGTPSSLLAEAWVLTPDPEGKWQQAEKVAAVAIHEVLEAAIPLRYLQIEGITDCSFLLSLEKEEVRLEIWPHRGFFCLKFPSPEEEMEQWSV